MASQAVRLASPSPRRAATRAVHAKPMRRAPSHARASISPARTAQRVVRAASWDLRIFGIAIGAIVLCFALALVYVSQTTALSVAGYDVQKLAADASRLGMVRAKFVPVISPQPLTAKR